MKILDGFAIKRNAKGHAAFATKNYRVGDVICLMRGKRGRLNDMDNASKNFRRAIMDPLQIGQETFIDLAKPYIYFNHSCDPNAGLKRTNTLFALKKIRVGEEITYDYSTNVDESFICKCGSRNCRKVIVDFFGLPASLQRRYIQRGAVQNFIRIKYEKIP